MLTEFQVISAVCAFLDRKGFRITQKLPETQRGIDIRAIARDGREVGIEAKGETSSMQHSARYGKVFSPGQVFDHVAKAMYTAACYSANGMLSGVAFPGNESHVKQVAPIAHAFRTLEIEVFWVLPDATVQVAGNWPYWEHHPDPST